VIPLDKLMQKAAKGSNHKSRSPIRR